MLAVMSRDKSPSIEFLSRWHILANTRPQHMVAAPSGMHMCRETMVVEVGADKWCKGATYSEVEPHTIGLHRPLLIAQAHICALTSVTASHACPLISGLATVQKKKEKNAT